MNQQHKICCTYQCIYNIDSRLDCQEKRVRFQCWWRGQRAKTSKTGDRQVRPDNEPRNYVAWLTATPGCTRYLIWDLCASCRNGDIAEIFYRPRQHLLLEVRSCGSCLGQLWGGEKSREPRSILPVDGFSIRSNSFTEKLNETTHTHMQAFHKLWKCVRSLVLIAQTKSKDFEDQRSTGMPWQQT